MLTFFLIACKPQTDCIIGQMSSSTLFGAGAAAMAVYAGWRYLDNKLNLSSDLRYAKKFGPLKKVLDAAQKEKMNITDLWRQAVAKWGNNESIVFEDRVYTYQQVDAESVNTMLI